MKRALLSIFAGLFALMLVGCSSQAPAPAAPAQPQRPAWTMNVPEVEGSDLYFVGISAVYASEQDARDNAMVNATKRVIEYIGTEAKSKFERARVSHGLASDAIDPVGATRDFQRQVSENATSQVKPSKFYLEKEQTPTGSGYKYFVLAKVPKAALNDAFANVLQGEKDKATQAALDARDEKARTQAQKAADMWADMEAQGVID
jgi:hypothetical protein